MTAVRWAGRTSAAEHGAALLAVVALIGLGASLMLFNAVQNRLRPAMKADVAALAALNQAREALIGFAVIHSRLPFPARPQTAAGTVFNGVPAGQEDPGRSAGVLPWTTLGMPETDGWGRRFSYRVTPAFTAPPTSPPTPAFDASTPGDITILDSIGGAVIASQVPAVIVCHGANGFNAHLPSGLQMPASPDADENANDMADAVFVRRNASDSFDDAVVWVDRTLLIDRLIQAGRLPAP